jgi:hypothetical protein
MLTVNGHIRRANKALLLTKIFRFLDDEPPVRIVLQPRPITAVNPLLSALPSDGHTPKDTKGTKEYVAEIPCKTKGKRKVMFEDEVASAGKDPKILNSSVTYSSGRSEGNSPTTTTKTTTIDLYNIESACDFLRQKCGCTDQVTDYQFIAFLQKPTFSKYIFYVSSGRQVSYEEVTVLKNRNISLYDFLKSEKEWTVTIVHQLKLALKLTLAVLQYHSTPWLDPEWRLSQLMLSMSPSKAPEDFSLYLNSKLTRTQPLKLESSSTSNSEIPEVQMTGSSNTCLAKSPLTEAQKHGIHNTTLFCLGLALLEIGRWKSLSSLREDYDRDDYETVWRLGYGSSVLGQGYDDIVLQCLRCDFGAKTTDLKRQELQNAVYNDIVCPLEDLIEGFSKMGI